jgi:hypothetical protein
MAVAHPADTVAVAMEEVPAAVMEEVLVVVVAMAVVPAAVAESHLADTVAVEKINSLHSL